MILSSQTSTNTHSNILYHSFTPSATLSLGPLCEVLAVGIQHQCQCQHNSGSFANGGGANNHHPPSVWDLTSLRNGGHNEGVPMSSSYASGGQSQSQGPGLSQGQDQGHGLSQGRGLAQGQGQEKGPMSAETWALTMLAR